MPNILDYYEYAKLATAAYVILDGKPLDGATVATEANSEAQKRLPLALAEQMFVRDPEKNPNPWTVPYYAPNRTGYYGNDGTGFAATLFQRDGESVIAFRGTEPTGSQLSLDLFKADLEQIGFFGLALDQTVSMVNLLLRWSAPVGENVRQFSWHYSPTAPEAGTPNVPISGGRGYISLSISDTAGLGLLAPGEKVVVTGHSLGGHLAALAARLFPDLVSDAYTYNAPGFDPNFASAAVALASLALLPSGLQSVVASIGEIAGLFPAKLTDEVIGMFGSLLPGRAPATSFEGLPIHNFESEDLKPGDDLSFVSSFLTNETALGARQDISVEADSHLIEPFMDSLALQALLYRTNTSLTLAELTRLLQVTAQEDERTQEILVDALYKIVGPEQNGLGPLPTVDVLRDDPVSGTAGIGAGNIEGRRRYYDKLLAVEGLLKGQPEATVVTWPT